VNDGLRLAVRQVRYENKAFWRNPASAFFTFFFPLLFLFVLTTLLKNDTSTLPTGQEVNNATYFTASILPFGVITACYTNLAMSVTFLRDQGVLKRVRGTPLPPWSYLLGRIIHAVAIMLVLVVIMLAFSHLAYDVPLPGRSAPAFLVTLAVGAFAFCAMGLAATAAVPNADAAPAVVNATVMPLLFLSGVFVPIDAAPGWVRVLANIFPVRPLLQAVTESLIPPTGNPSGWHFAGLAIVALWGVGAVLVASRWFRWESRR
jgi:ABC-2 type transport system permease protein